MMDQIGLMVRKCKFRLINMVSQLLIYVYIILLIIQIIILLDRDYKELEFKVLILVLIVNNVLRLYLERQEFHLLLLEDIRH